MRTPLFLCSLLLATGLLPAIGGLAGAQLPVVQPCGNSTIHTYHDAGGTASLVDGTLFPPRAQTKQKADDTCPLHVGAPSATDHDRDAGIGGGLFYASATCGPAPGSSSWAMWSPHHAFAHGSNYTANQAGPGSAMYIVGTDGAAEPGLLGPCLGNGIVTDDPTTDPRDCGSGVVGVSEGGPLATIGWNVVGNDCDPSSGYVWVALLRGPVIRGSTVFLSTPTWGTITG